ncbi:MAG: hypothetical protein QUS66_08675, partial [Bacteroidota bacterium]|nr:hypothetical protein [Bacteroidota bacterium]
MQHRRKGSEKLLRFALWFSLSIVTTLFYSLVFHRLFGSPKEELLQQQVDELKLRYTLLEKHIDRSSSAIAEMRSSDNTSYRAVLDMPLIPSDISQGGAGGTNRTADMTGYLYSDLMIRVRSKFDNLKTQTNIQYNSFTEVNERADEWKEMWAHLPYIRPVNVLSLIHISEPTRQR